MLKVLVYAYRDWSFANIQPVLDQFEWIRWCDEQGPPPNFDDFDLIITCEPHIEGWVKWYPELRKKHKVLAMQQGLYWSDSLNPHAQWSFNKIMVWGTLMGCVMDRYKMTDRVFVTGNPRFDEFYDMPTFDGNYALILGSGGEGGHRYRRQMFVEKDVKFQPHPNVCNYKMSNNTIGLIQSARKVIFKCTGTGIIAMIMKKPVKILPFIHQKSYLPCKLYNSGQYGFDPDFVTHATMGPGSTDRVHKAIMEFVGE